jgi:DNA-binding NarL/FixJ family response regulator
MTEKLTQLVVDAQTGEAVQSELSADEIADRNKLAADFTANAEAKASARESALAKLAALGLTEEEIAAL